MQIESFKFTNEATQKVVTVGNNRLLRQYPDNDSGRQRFLRLTAGTTQLASRAYNRSSVIDAIGGDLTVPAVLQIYPSHGGPNQRWKIHSEGSSGSGLTGHEVFSIKADGTEMAWDVPNGDAANGNYIQVYPWHGGTNQLWRMEPKTIDTVVLKSLHNSRVLDVPGFASGHAFIQHYAENGGFNQAWELEDLGGNERKIRSVSSGRYLTSSIVTVDNDTFVYQGVSSTDPNQIWIVSFGAGGNGTIRNKGTDMALSVNSAPGGDFVRCLPGGGAGHQQWTMIA
jgi:hypothetical protein